ncbi:MAG: formylglycine-generating enzyme family protein [Hydrogenophaga sp.]|jgi:formylglycine-generating enzyme required for sulfatase activity|uniref:formylglycine-generating enzyme family protein n=1 Tax=Hydrogenophaga sp. TaxID=1904254 RepID=UPI00271A9C13|nr:formylglycine-generating enzyme family protein [Hydrogenophaga sp.]MDO9569938.1 formylglycine-generating enzyme family protein [Hydrogenophaga sp.]MDP3376364.1 formylglycine-generating enzyme family protein [Hydrogenophaga sp.]
MSYWPKDVEHRAPLHDFPPAWASAWGDDRYGLWADLVVGGVAQRMRWIEPSMPGGFWMGSPQKERDAIPDKRVRLWANERESEPRRVFVAQGFWLADTPCTQAFWLAVMGSKNPSYFHEVDDVARRPVERVPFDDDLEGPGVSAFLQALNQRLPEPRAALPSEEEWEYACRADTLTAYWWGDTFDPEHANVNHTGKKNWNTNEGTTPVGRYPPNPWGLYDMHGNVWEWTSSPWRERLDGNKGLTPPLAHVVRGGSWIFHPGRSRSATRYRWPLGDRDRDQGFRLVLRCFSSLP